MEKILKQQKQLVIFCDSLYQQHFYTKKSYFIFSSQSRLILNAFFNIFDVLLLIYLRYFIDSRAKMKRLEELNRSVVSGTSRQQFLYSVPCGPAKKGETSIYRKPSHKDGLLKVTQYASLADFWDQKVKHFGNRPCLENQTYQQINEKMLKVGSWIQSQKHKLFFLYAKNRPEWTITDIASWNYGLINVPLYDTLGSQAFEYILRITQGTLLCTTSNLADNLWNYLNKDMHNIQQICFFDSIDQNIREKFFTLNVEIFTFDQLLSFDKILPKANSNLNTELTYGFTSGTTGVPKGVIYTHRMVISQCLALRGHCDRNQNDVHLSFLPIAHTFQRFSTWSCLQSGANIRYAKHPMTQILKDIAEVRPTALPMVPRLLNKFYPIFKELYEKQGNYKKMKMMLGGRIRRVSTGSAPVSPHILTFFQQGLQCDVRQGYGQTQTTAASFVTYQGDTNYGIVGGPNSATEFKLVDVPEMNYLSTDNPPRGEVCTRGQSVFAKYFKDEKNTRESIDEDGWNHSGDIGMIMPNGALKIIDRKKNIFKLQQGEYIAPQKIENIYARCKFINESFLYGDSLQDYNVVIIHPNLDLIHSIATNLGIHEADAQKLCQEKKIRQFILEEINKQGRHDGLMSFQMAKKIRLTHLPFQTAGIVTATMKLQRHIARKVFEKEIKQMYQK